MPLHISSTCAHHQEVKIALHSIWYHHYHHTYRCDDTRGCVMQFWPPDEEHMCSKHVEAWNKFIVKQKFCASSWLITETNILRCKVSKTSKSLSTCFGRICSPSSGAILYIYNNWYVFCFLVDCLLAVRKYSHTHQDIWYPHLLHTLYYSQFLKSATYQQWLMFMKVY